MTKEDQPRAADPTPAAANGRVYDLAERTARFGEEVVRFCRAFPKSAVNEPLVRQFVRSGTSVGANYCEADDAVSKKEFFQKIGTCKKEARETKHWLRMLAAAEPERKADMNRAAEWLHAKLENIGFKSEILETAGHSVV